MMAVFVVMVAIPAKRPDDTSAQGNGKNGNDPECSESTWQFHGTPHVEVDIASNAGQEGVADLGWRHGCKADVKFKQQVVPTDTAHALREAHPSPLAQQCREGAARRRGRAQ
jgi:hypothetical protein